MRADGYAETSLLVEEEIAGKAKGRGSAVGGDFLLLFFLLLETSVRKGYNSGRLILRWPNAARFANAFNCALVVNDALNPET